MVNLIINYPAFILTAATLTAIFLTILTADKAKNRHDYLSDLMMQDGSSLVFMTLGMFIASIFTALSVVIFDKNQNTNLSLFSYIVVLASLCFFVSPIFLWFQKYRLHLFPIRMYFFLMFVAEFLIPITTGKYRGVLLGIAIINLLITCLTFRRARIRWLPEVSFAVLTLIYLVILNLITIN